MGRRKIEMKMVESKSSRQVTFSKRRTGVFKKANELAILCGVIVTIIVFSPGGKPYSFGNPNVESIVDRFINEEDEEDQDRVSNEDAGAENRRLDAEYQKLVTKLNEEQKKGKRLDKKVAKYKSVADLNLEELVSMKEPLEKLRDDVKEKIEQSHNDIEASSALLMLSKSPVVYRRRDPRGHG